MPALKNLCLLQNLLLHNRFELQPKCTTTPKPMRPHPPPPEEDSFNPYELGLAIKGLIEVSESMEGVGWMWKPGRTANLFLMVQEEKRLYVAIKNLSRLLRSSNSEHHNKHYFCLNCLQGFHGEESRNKYFEYWVDNEAVRIDMLEENSFMRFHGGQYD